MIESTVVQLNAPLQVSWAHEALLAAYEHGPAGFLQRFRAMPDHQTREVLRTAQSHAIDFEEGTSSWIYAPQVNRQFVAATLAQLLPIAQERLSQALQPAPFASLGLVRTSTGLALRFALGGRQYTINLSLIG